MTAPEPSQRGVIRLLIRCDHPKRHIVTKTLLDTAARAFSRAICIQENAEHHLRVIGGAAPSTRARPPITWGIPLTAQTQPKKFATPFLIALSPTHTGLGVATWPLIARGITPLREDDLTNKVGAVNDKALTRIDDAIRMLYEL